MSKRKKELGRTDVIVAELNKLKGFDSVTPAAVNQIIRKIKRANLAPCLSLDEIKEVLTKYRHDLMTEEIYNLAGGPPIEW